MEGFVNEIRNHLETRLIPFWERLKDEEHGGFPSGKGLRTKNAADIMVM